jgi:hypothetical protein
VTNETLGNQNRPAPLYLFDYEVESLSDILGFPKDQLTRSESEFLAETGCPPKSLEIWLMTFWVQHDIRAVLAGTQTVVRQPWLLRSNCDGTVRLFSPSDRLVLANAAQEIAMSARYEVPGEGQEPLSAEDLLAWWDHLDKARSLCVNLCRASRAHDWSEATAPQKTTILACLEEIEKRISILWLRSLQEVGEQLDAIEKCMILGAQLAGYCGDVAVAMAFAEEITHDKRRWASFLEALVGSRWLDSDSPRAYLNRTTQTVYIKGRPDRAGRDSQGMYHRAGQGGVTKPSDALYGFNIPSRGAERIKKSDPPPTPEELAYDYAPRGSTNCSHSLEEIVEKPSEPILERVFTQQSVRELEEAARKDPRLTAYIRVTASHPKWKRAAIWQSLGWNEQDGKALDRRYRRLRNRLRTQGAGMEWREIPELGVSQASQNVYFEVLQDGARGSCFGLYQHKSLKTKEK